MIGDKLSNKTALMLSREDYKQYNPFINFGRKKKGVQDRYTRAYKTAKNVAGFLRKKYQANKVYLFGSLSDINYFTEWSDIDLAVSGIQPSLFYRAVADVEHFNQEFEIDLVDLSDCNKRIKQSVETYGVEI